MALVVSPREFRQIPIEIITGSEPVRHPSTLKRSSSRFSWIASSFLSQSEREVAMLQANLQSSQAHLEASSRLVESAKARERDALKRIRHDSSAIVNANAVKAEAADEGREWRAKLEQTRAQLKALNERMQHLEDRRDDAEREGRELRQVVRRQAQDLRMSDAMTAGRAEGRATGFAEGVKDGRVEGFLVGRRDSTRLGRAGSIKSIKSSSTRSRMKGKLNE